ncbi:MAG: hypothetical protein KGL53_16275 [Elusimicrobia bacterium]|nr:hypothetical protein [Elusimicrobiota bacterium]
MKRVLAALAVAVLAATAAAAKDSYRVRDHGGFGSTGRLVEMSSRYGWASYDVDFKFGLDLDARELARGSKLKLTITRHDGSRWKAACKAGDDRTMWANINQLFNKGTSVLVECRLPPKKFGKLVGLDAGLVGMPTLVFQVNVQAGKAVAGPQKGFYLLSSGQIQAGELASYASAEADPSALSVLFSSDAGPDGARPAFAMAPPRFLP